MTSTAGLVARFSAVGLAVLAALVALLAVAARKAGAEQAIKPASEVAMVTAKGVVEPRLNASVLAGDPVALRGFDDAVRRYVLSASLVRVKIWDQTGKIIYSDRPELVGTRWTLEQDEVDALLLQRIESEISDLSRPE